MQSRIQYMATVWPFPGLIMLKPIYPLSQRDSDALMTSHIEKKIMEDIPNKIMPNSAPAIKSRGVNYI